MYPSFNSLGLELKKEETGSDHQGWNEESGARSPPSRGPLLWGAVALLGAFSVASFHALQGSSPGYVDEVCYLTEGVDIADAMEEEEEKLGHGRRLSRAEIEGAASESRAMHGSMMMEGLEREQQAQKRRPSTRLKRGNGSCQRCALAGRGGGGGGERRPVRSHHCRVCDRCVLKFDHHCAVLGTCIGENNHLRFWIMLSVHCLWIAAAMLALHSPSTGPSSLGMGGGTLLGCLALLELWLGLLLAAHSYLALANLTSVEMMQDWGTGAPMAYTLRHVAPWRVPFVGRYLHNLRLFCCFQDDYCVRAGAVDWLLGRAVRSPPWNMWEVESQSVSGRYAPPRSCLPLPRGRWPWRRLWWSAFLRGKREEEDNGDTEEDILGDGEGWGDESARLLAPSVRLSVWEDVCDNECYSCC